MIRNSSRSSCCSTEKPYMFTIFGSIESEFPDSGTSSAYGNRTHSWYADAARGNSDRCDHRQPNRGSPFSDKQIELLETFADQAVIAIENVRLFQELEARTRELAQSVGELRALGEVGQAVSSTLDLQTVLSTIVGHAVELSATSGGIIYEYDEAKQELPQSNKTRAFDRSSGQLHSRASNGSFHYRRPRGAAFRHRAAALSTNTTKASKSFI